MAGHPPYTGASIEERQRNGPPHQYLKLEDPIALEFVDKDGNKDKFPASHQCNICTNYTGFEPDKLPSNKLKCVSDDHKMCTCMMNDGNGRFFCNIGNTFEIAEEFDCNPNGVPKKKNCKKCLKLAAHRAHMSREKRKSQQHQQQPTDGDENERTKRVAVEPAQQSSPAQQQQFIPQQQQSSPAQQQQFIAQQQQQLPAQQQQQYPIQVQSLVVPQSVAEQFLAMQQLLAQQLPAAVPPQRIPVPPQQLPAAVPPQQLPAAVPSQQLPAAAIDPMMIREIVRDEIRKFFEKMLQ
jgi:hypothetical protein